MHTLRNDPTARPRTPAYKRKTVSTAPGTVTSEDSV
jgi:hypothetical protein